MDPRYFALNEKILKLVKSPVDQGRIVAAAVAMAISALGALPSSPTDNVQGYYGAQVQPMAMKTISDFGEGVVFASRTALEYTQTFWKMRYYAAHPAVLMAGDFQYQMETTLNAANVSGFCCSTLWQGGITLMSAELDAFLNKYKKEILVLATIISDLVKEQPHG